MGTFMLTSGLLIQFRQTSRQSSEEEEEGGGVVEKASEPEDVTPLINVDKAVRGFGVLGVALSSQALTLVALLLEDLSSEVKEVSTVDDQFNGFFRRSSNVRCTSWIRYSIGAGCGLPRLKYVVYK